MRVALISLEPWDEVWRRNQYFATELVRQGFAIRRHLRSAYVGGPVARPASDAESS